MELDDCAFPLLAGIVRTDDANVAFGDADVALLVGLACRASRAWSAATCSRPTAASSRPRARPSPTAQPTDVKILVVGNPANTNALIAKNNAPDIRPSRFTAMTRLDHNRAMAQLAAKLGAPVNDVTKMTIWGNHSATQYPDLFHAEVGGKDAADAVGDQSWLESDFIPTVQKRGAAIIEARGASSAASAANAAIDHMHDWALGTPEGDWVSMGVPSDGSYGVPEGSCPRSRAPARTGESKIVQGLDIDDFCRATHRRVGRRARRGARRGQGASA